MTGLDLLVGLLVVLGLVGIATIVLPGILLVYGAILAWAFIADTPYQWTVVGLATVLLLASQMVKVLVPGRQLTTAGVPGRSIAVGGVAGIVGFFVIPVVGLVVGFVLGILGAELLRLRDLAAARGSTVSALKAVGVSILVELAAGLLMTVVWGAAVIAS